MNKNPESNHQTAPCRRRASRLKTNRRKNTAPMAMINPINNSNPSASRRLPIKVISRRKSLFKKDIWLNDFNSILARLKILWYFFNCINKKF